MRAARLRGSISPCILNQLATSYTTQGQPKACHVWIYCDKGQEHLFFDMTTTIIFSQGSNDWCQRVMHIHSLNIAVSNKQLHATQYR